MLQIHSYGNYCMKQIKFNFTNTSVVFDLVDAPVADAWWQQMKTKATHEQLVPRITMEPDFPRFRDINECNNNILHNVKQMQQFDFYLNWPTDISTVTQDKLNTLHQQFHQKEEEHKDTLPQQAHDILQLINQYVHQMEQIMWSMTGDPVNYAVLDFGTQQVEQQIQRPIALKERQWFQEAYYEQQNNTCLLLGYATLGKHLGHCVWTDDVEVVRSNMLRPQQFIYTQVLFRQQPNFVSKTQDEIHSANTWTENNTREWIKSNALEDYVDANDPVHLYNTAPVVAYINNDYASMTEQDWHELWTQQKFTSIELTKI